MSSNCDLTRLLCLWYRLGMSGLPARFPRASLINAAGMLESRVNRLLDETHQLIEWSEEHSNQAMTNKLARRFNALDEARKCINEARMALWDLP